MSLQIQILEFRCGILRVMKIFPSTPLDAVHLVYTTDSVNDIRVIAIALQIFICLLASLCMSLMSYPLEMLQVIYGPKCGL
ncbi:hypothetical protein N7504_005954 [Penicillium tannophilum]|nr:hypothetical protein N7504_005954 [Penicillium tannophilum]